ncbi:MAG: SH3 domain-containing protein [Saprospiraceae bacterium]|nr:SH3 domain-containing protein [Saprospiraceae bacterium]
MKNLICILIISFAAFSAKADTIPQIERVNVYALSGLSLRAIPTLEGQMLKVIPFGENVQIIEKTNKSQTIEWMSGHWIKVRYQGLEGYIFDGFTSDLPFPMLSFELTQEDLDLSYPLLAWAEYHFDQIGEADTIRTEGQYGLVQHLENGIRLQREDSDYHFKASIILPGRHISEAYNLLRSMLLTKNERIAYNQSSVFLANVSGNIDHIKINLDSPVEIRTLPDGSVKISVITFHEGCTSL